MSTQLLGWPLQSEPATIVVFIPTTTIIGLNSNSGHSHCSIMQKCSEHESRRRGCGQVHKGIHGKIHVTPSRKGRVRSPPFGCGVENTSGLGLVGFFRLFLEPATRKCAQFASQRREKHKQFGRCGGTSWRLEICGVRRKQGGRGNIEPVYGLSHNKVRSLSTYSASFTFICMPLSLSSG